MAVEPEMNEEDVRAVMAVRLNTILVGNTGIQPEVAMMYKEFFNRGIHPIVPVRGSVGEADIASLSHIGLAMIGEGEVIYKGKRMAASEAIEIEGINPIQLGPKDGLAIVSSSALSAGMAALILKDAIDLVETANIIYALSLEGLNGNVTPLDQDVNKIRKMPGQIYSAEMVRKYLENSYLTKKDITKTLQDPLSFRDAIAVHGSVLDAIDYVIKYLLIQLNTSDDNPCVLLEKERIISCCNFEITNWVIGFEMLGLALSHLSKMSCHRTIKLSNPVFTRLTRFLTPSEGDILGYATIQKPFTALDTEIRHLSNPATADFFSVAGEIEDHANNTPFVVRKTRQIIDNLYYILGIEAMHAVQAIDLRDEVKLGRGTGVAYRIFRKHIPFLDKDRPLTPDIKKAYEIIKLKEILHQVQKELEIESSYFNEEEILKNMYV